MVLEEVNFMDSGLVEVISEWIDEHTNLRTLWPYDELEGLILDVLQDGVINKKEHRTLLHFFSEFTEQPCHRAIEPSKSEKCTLITGVCAVCPEIDFTDRRFCFTGRSKRFSRQEFVDHITQLGGIFCKSLGKEVDYLAVGADGNPCWAYACYGRKVEKAIKYRKQGASILLVHEYDLWDAMQDGS